MIWLSLLILVLASYHNKITDVLIAAIVATEINAAITIIIIFNVVSAPFVIDKSHW